MKTIQFEGVKIAIKQDQTGYVLTLRVHPDNIPEDLLRDFVGARYQVVMVRIGSDEQPYERDDKIVQRSALICKEKEFWMFLYENGEIFPPEEKEATDWLREHLQIGSRAELKTNEMARKSFEALEREYAEWKKS